MSAPLPRRLLAEYLGALLLAALVIGSGIAAQNLSPHDVGLQSGADHSDGTKLCKAAHRPQPGLESPMICFDEVIAVLAR